MREAYIRRLGLLLGILITAASLAWGQQNATVVGTITDPTGAVAADPGPQQRHRPSGNGRLSVVAHRAAVLDASPERFRPFHGLYSRGEPLRAE